MTEKFVYAFEDGNKEMKSLLGGKGANLSEMSNIGLPVPPGFTITTRACNKYYEDGQKIGEDLKSDIFKFVEDLEKKIGKKFGNKENPLLVSVRSGAAISMPGMMDTVLNLGLNDEVANGMSELTGNPRLVYDSYRRFIQMFSDVVLGIEKHNFDLVFDGVKEQNNIENDFEIPVDLLKVIIDDYKEIVEEETGSPFPVEPTEQLILAVDAVFRSWNNERAIIYRDLNNIPHDIGTAVNIQSMVFGNMGDSSGTGVAFTRDPATGEKKLFGEFLMNAQGEDVVAGIRTPNKIEDLKEILPKAYNQFIEIAELLEKHYKDMQDIEFTIENEKLFLLQTRNGKRTAAASVNIAIDMVNEGVLTKSEAIMKIDPLQIDQLLHPTYDDEDLKKATLIAKGLPASPGAASGKIYFNSHDLEVASEKGETCILVRNETSPEDIKGMIASKGILTARGGMTSHAAVVARGMGKCCVAGCSELEVDEKGKVIRCGDKVYKEGDYISLYGNTGAVYEGSLPTKDVTFSERFNLLLSWSDQLRTLKVRTNADTPFDSKTAVDFGAEGIGLCRTEHMFFDAERIVNVREMIVAENSLKRERALEKLFPYQVDDFIGIYEAMEERPVTIRLLDPPLHEFLPHGDAEIEKLAKDLNLQFSDLKQTVEGLQEFNPMLGHRGCRLGITYPEIYKMQTKAIITAALKVKKEKGLNIVPEIMIPLIGIDREIEILRESICETADEIIKESGMELDYLVGTMIEIPRAALTADEVAKYADFFSFGTNDLTQMAYGFSRDDSGKFITEYKKLGIFERDPFVSIDQKGVGKLISMSVKLGRETKKDLKIGICGEQGGDPESIDFCHRTGLDYVSCSPYRVPIARVAAAQAAIKYSNE
ncbi:MAG: pyruvate, phosphate dikinase [Candidatus Cloacimonadota bacterium]|nr:MAG: pyruvate, phosphate dikinase [Candidatus Cloacimonadota bacterium]PIE78634.1 MAG: pyruvate, phosphate dikinase [Candidatus Delongbacteria bacterium]